MIDVRQFLKEHSVDELNLRAEEYFSAIDDRSYLLSKPFAEADDCAKLLIEFWAGLLGLELRAGMSVLDFGPGSCWTSHFLTQMGCKVYPFDVSPSALEIGKARYRQHPPFGTQPEPEFVVYDGHNFPMPDASIDRVLCMHALHHVPNLGRVLEEMSRVLNDRGIAAFVEPGPRHSQGAESQFELGRGILENDIVIEDIWRLAQAAGFKRIQLAVFPRKRTSLSLDQYSKLLAGDKAASRLVLEPIVEHANDTRTFFLYKNADTTIWSTDRNALFAELDVHIDGRVFRVAGRIVVNAKVKNLGPATWLQTLVAGRVCFGSHLKNLMTGEYLTDYSWDLLDPSTKPIVPGQTVRVESSLPVPAPGKYEISFDLVSDQVCWFASMAGCRPVSFVIEVVG